MCSFCGKSRAEVKKLIAGPGVYICDSCVVVCQGVLAKEVARDSVKDLREGPRLKPPAGQAGRLGRQQHIAEGRRPTNDHRLHRSRSTDSNRKPGSPSAVPPARRANAATGVV